MTFTCFPEPVTSSGHLSLLHLGDESMLHALTCVFSHYCQLFPGFHCHIINFVTYGGLTAFLSHSKSPISSSCLYFASAFLCTGLFVSLLWVMYLSWVLESQLPWAHPKFAYCVPHVFKSHYVPLAIFTLTTCCYQQKSEPQQQNSRNQHVLIRVVTVHAWIIAI